MVFANKYIGQLLPECRVVKKISFVIFLPPAGEESAAAVHSGAQSAEGGSFSRLANLISACLVSQLAVCCSYWFYNSNGGTSGCDSLFHKMNAASLSLCDKQRYLTYRESITGLQWDSISSEYTDHHESSWEAAPGGASSRKEFVGATTLKNME